MSTLKTPRTDSEITAIKNSLYITFTAAKILAEKNTSLSVDEIISIEKNKQRERSQNHSLTSKK